MHSHPDVLNPIGSRDDGLEQLLVQERRQSQVAKPARLDGVRVGRLVAMHDDGCTPLVTFDGQPGPAAQPTRSTIDLHGCHVGREVLLVFEDGDPHRPIVIGCIRIESAGPVGDLAGRVEVDLDGARLVVSAREQLVLRCGKASVTLTRAGKVLIEGAFILSRSSGVNRIKGGSVEIN